MSIEKLMLILTILVQTLCFYIILVLKILEHKWVKLVREIVKKRNLIHSWKFIKGEYTYY